MTTVLVAHPGAELYGSDRVMLESVVAFTDQGWDVHVTTPAAGPLVPAVEGAGATWRAVPALVLRKSYLSARGSLALVRDTARALRAGRRLLRQVRPDVVYVSTVTLPVWTVLARVRGVPVVCHVHEGESEARRLLRWALAVPLLATSRVVVNSEFSTGVLVEVLPRLRRRCHVVYNGVAGPRTVTHPRRTVGGPVRLVYLGRLSERKGVQDALSALAHLQDLGFAAQLRVVGSAFAGYEQVETALRQQAAALPEGSVEFTGFDADVWPHLEWADVLLVPSRGDEPFGNTAVEGALAARPVVVSATTGLLEAAAGRAAVVAVPPQDPEAVARAVVTMLEDWDGTRRAAVQDAEPAARRFAPATYRHAMSRHLRDVLPPRT